MSAFLSGCRTPDSVPLEAVAIPASAYGPFDAGIGHAVAAAAPLDAGRQDEEILCEPQPEDDEVVRAVFDDEIGECPAKRARARLNRSVTRARRRGEPTTCCYGGWDASRKRGVIRIDEME